MARGHRVTYGSDPFVADRSESAGAEWVPRTSTLPVADYEYRHSALTCLVELGASLLMLMAKSRHRKPESVRRYFKASPEAIAELTSLLAPRGTSR